MNTLKQIAEEARDEKVWGGYDGMVGQTNATISITKYLRTFTPAKVLELLEENERLTKIVEQWDSLK